MDKELKDLVIKALDYYDSKNNEYKKLIKYDNFELNKTDNEIQLNEKKFKYEVLGIFDNSVNVWIWAWMIPSIEKNSTIIVKKLLNYGLNIEENLIEELYLKIQFTNSRFLLEDKLQLEIHLALSSYLVKENIKFILPAKKYLNKEKTRFITIYYLIK